MLILVKSLRAGERVKASVTRYVTLKLVVNEQKSRVVKTQDCEFLQFGVSMAYRFERLARYVRGWMNYFGISDYYRPIPEIAAWLRRRIRMCYWKQWRWVRTKVRHLLALGTSKRQAILTALSSKSYWHPSKTLAPQTGMTNAWLTRQGLISVRALWLRAHGYS